MKKFLFLIIFANTLSLLGYSQKDTRQVVGVAKFKSDTDTKFASQITERVVDILINSKRFQVVDRTTNDKIKAELEFQKTENFIDSKSTSQRGVMVGADFMVTGTIGAINVTRVLNVDGSIGGYKATLTFTVKIVETATSISSEAHTFESNNGDRELSPEKAVQSALNTIEPQMKEYFANNFPVNVKIAKVLTSKKDAAATVLISAGKDLGIIEGDKFVVQKMELLDGKPYPTDIGEIKITKLAGDNFSECQVTKGGKEILTHFTASENIMCKLIRK